MLREKAPKDSVLGGLWGHNPSMGNEENEANAQFYTKAILRFRGVKWLSRFVASQFFLKVAAMRDWFSW